MASIGMLLKKCSVESTPQVQSGELPADGISADVTDDLDLSDHMEAAAS